MTFDCYHFGGWGEELTRAKGGKYFFTAIYFNQNKTVFIIETAFGRFFDARVLD